MPPRPKVDADLIAALRSRAVTHNEAFPHAKVKLGDLKKVWIHGWRRGRGSQQGAEAAVTKHLDRLAALTASAQSVEALAKASFDETEHRRDNSGRFAPKGGGAPAAYRSVRTPDDHQRARSENEGYRAATTQVIPETRGSTFGGVLGVAALTGLAAVRGARADKPPTFVGKAPRTVASWLAGGVAGRVASGAAAVKGRVENSMRRMAGEAPRDYSRDVARAQRQATAATIRGTQKAADAVGRWSFGLSRGIIESAKRGAQVRGLKGLPKLTHMAVARLGAAGTATLVPGLLTVPAGWYIGDKIAGPTYDALFPRRVQKIAALSADPRSVEVLAKAAPGAAAFRALGSILRRAPAAKRPLPTQGINAMFGRVKRSVGVGAALGAAAGGAIGGGAVLGARRFYRDKDGKFTSKEKDVSSTLGGVLAGAAAGALAGAAFVRGRNRKLANDIARRVLNTKAKFPVAGADGKTSLTEGTLEQARQLIANKKLKPSDVTLVGGQKDANTTRTKFADWIAGRQERAKAATQASFKGALDGRDKIAEARISLARAANASDESWAEFQILERLRDNLRGQAGKQVFKRPGPAPKGAPDAYTNATSLLTNPPRMREVKGTSVLSDPLGDTINALRGVPADQRNPAGLNGLLTGTRFDSLTTEQKRVISQRVWQADDAIQAVKGASARASVAEKSLNEAKENALNFSKQLKEKAGENEEVLAPIRRQLGQEQNRIKAAQDELAQAQAAAKPKNPFGGVLEPRKTGEDFERAMDVLRRQMARLTAPQKAKMADAAARPVNQTLAAIEDLERQGRPSRLGRRVADAMGPVGRGAARLGRQTRLITGDATERTRITAGRVQERLRDVFFGVPDASGKRVGGAVASAKSAYETVRGPAAKARAWAAANPMKVRGAVAALLAGGILDVAPDGKFDLNWNRTPDAFKNIIDKKTRPQAAMYQLNGGRDVAMVMVGKTKAGKGMEAQDIILSGVILRGDGSASTDIAPMTPVKMFLDNQKGGGGGQQRGALPLNPQERQAVDKALKDLGTNVQKTDDEDDEAYTFRNHKDSTQDKAAELFAASVSKEIPSRRGGAGFYEVLGSIFSEQGGVLKENEKRALLFGGKVGDAQVQALLEGGAQAYKSKDADGVFNALKNKIENPKLSIENDDQAKLLRNAVSLMTRQHSYPRISEQQKNDLFKAIANKRGSAGAAPAGGAGAGPTPSSGGTSTPDPIKFEQGQLAQNFKTLISNASTHSKEDRDFLEALQSGSRALFQAEFDGLSDGMPTPERAREARFRALRQAMIDYETKRGGTLTTAQVRRIDTFMDAVRKSWSAGDLAKLNAASVEALSKAEIPPGGAARRQFEEQKIRRNPGGNDRGGEFAPKAGARQGKPTEKREPREPRQPRTPREQPKEQGYFEPVRLGGTLGGAAGGQAAFEIASRYLPGPLRSAGMVGRLAYRMGAAMVGGGVGAVGGEAAGRATYDDPRKAPGSFEPKERSLGEEAARIAGGTAGAFVGAMARSPVKAFALGVGGQLGGEELAAAAHGIISRYYGQEAASRAARGSLPTQRQPV